MWLFPSLRGPAVTIMPDRLSLLTDRERDCLRLVHRGYESKEIGPLLGISPDRVNKVVGAAKRKLGVSRRVTAARLLAEYEEGSVSTDPTHSMGGQPMGVAHPPPLVPDRPTEQPIGLERDRAETAPEEPKPPQDISVTGIASLPLPIRGMGRLRNDLSQRATLVAIALIALAATGTAGAAASFLLVVNWLVEGR